VIELPGETKDDSFSPSGLIKLMLDVAGFACLWKAINPEGLAVAETVKVTASSKPVTKVKKPV